MIVITGAAGFIGSCLISKLNSEGINNLILVDDFTNQIKNKNLGNKKFLNTIHRDTLFEWIEKNYRSINFIFHIGARTDTIESDYTIFERLNLNYTKSLWNICSRCEIPMLYASSAATYGIGDHTFKDDHKLVSMLNPLNPYAISKNEFDKWMLSQEQTPPFWAGIKFFNVYGPNEYHKERMASVVFHAFNQILETGKMQLFRSHNTEFKDGEQLRDFIYIKDVVDVLYFMMQNNKDSGIYNLGVGEARTFLELSRNIFISLKLEENIIFIDTPSNIRDKYQYFTKADMNKLRSVGYRKDFTTLEIGIQDYIENYLLGQNYY